jgi:hypothetical protein
MEKMNGNVNIQNFFLCLSSKTPRGAMVSMVVSPQIHVEM